MPSALSVISLRVWRGGWRPSAWWATVRCRDMMEQCPEQDWSPVFTVSYCYPLMSTSTHCHPEPRAAIPTRQPPSISARLSSAAGETQVDRKVGPRLSSSRHLRYLGWGLAPSWHSTAVVCPLLPLAPAVYWKNVNFELFTCNSVVSR